MIIYPDSNPESSVYFIGSVLLECVSEATDDVLSLLDLYEALSKKRTVSFSLYELSLTWLFILGLIEHTQQGKLRKCF